jgi:hypothetical protein
LGLDAGAGRTHDTCSVTGRGLFLRWRQVWRPPGFKYLGSHS